MTVINDSHSHHQLESKTLLPFMLVLSIISVGLGYLTSILAARLLGPAEYENFMVALGILAAIAESGVGKLALKTIPGYKTSEQWSLASGYWRFSLRMVLFVSILLLISVATWEWVEDAHYGDHPLGIAVLFLPAIVLSGAGVDFVMANRAAVTGALIARLVVPGTTVLLFIAAEFLTHGLSLDMAVIGYGTGSVIGAILCVLVFRRTSPANFFQQSLDIIAPNGYVNAYTLQPLHSYLRGSFVLLLSYLNYYQLPNSKPHI